MQQSQKFDTMKKGDVVITLANLMIVYIKNV